MTINELRKLKITNATSAFGVFYSNLLDATLKIAKAANKEPETNDIQRAIKKIIKENEKAISVYKEYASYSTSDIESKITILESEISFNRDFQVPMLQESEIESTIASLIINGKSKLEIITYFKENHELTVDMSIVNKYIQGVK